MAWNIKSKRKSYEKEGLYFSGMLKKMADEWETIVSTARNRRQMKEHKAIDQEKEIQKQERLDWERYIHEKEGYTIRTNII